MVDIALCRGMKQTCITSFCFPSVPFPYTNMHLSWTGVFRIQVCWYSLFLCFTPFLLPSFLSLSTIATPSNLLPLPLFRLFGTLHVLNWTPVSAANNNITCRTTDTSMIYYYHAYSQNFFFFHIKMCSRRKYTKWESNKVSEK